MTPIECSLSPPRLVTPTYLPLHQPMSWQFMNTANRQSHKAISYQVKPVLFSFSSEKSIAKLKGKEKQKPGEHQKKYYIFLLYCLLSYCCFTSVVVVATALLLCVILEWAAAEKYVIIGKTMTKHTSNSSGTERKKWKGEFIFSTFWQVPLIILSMKKQRRRLA